MRKGKNRYIVEVNDWGCGLMIKDTQTGREIDAPDDEVITLCIKEMNSLAKELDTVRSVAEDNQAELKATRIENARLKAEVERLTEAGDRLCDKEFVETMGDYEFDNEAYAIRIRNWHKAKEGRQP